MKIVSLLIIILFLSACETAWTKSNRSFLTRTETGAPLPKRLSFPNLKKVEIYCWCFGDPNTSCTTSTNVPVESLLKKDYLFCTISDRQQLKIISNEIKFQIKQSAVSGDYRLVFLFYSEKKTDTIGYFQKNLGVLNNYIYQSNGDMLNSFERCIGKKIRCK